MKKNTIVETLKTISTLLIQGNYGVASSQFNQVLLQIQTLIAYKKNLKENQQQLLAALQICFTQQQRNDWISLSDAIEYHLIPAIEMIDSAE